VKNGLTEGSLILSVDEVHVNARRGREDIFGVMIYRDALLLYRDAFLLYRDGLSWSGNPITPATEWRYSRFFLGVLVLCPAY
jgi:hypothetical protein